jgi:sugar lactone lactonase YvrE
MLKKIPVLLGLSLFTWALAWADDDHDARFPRDASFTTLITTKFAIEGLTGDDRGNLYTTGRPGGQPCPVWRIAANEPTPDPIPIVGFVPTPCAPSGITFGSDGDLFISNNNDTIYRLTPNAANPPTATPYATGVPGTNGLAFDRDGNLWTGDGTTGQGRVWKIPPGGGAGIEMFRVQPLLNQVSVGRDVRTVPTGNSQPLVANGVAFTHDGDLLIADTARGAIWKVEFDHHGNLKSRTGCDSTFSANTLCLDNVFVAHPLLEGTDGIALDRAGNIWNSANERNAIVVVTQHRGVVEIFRNPPNAAGLRNSADPTVGNDHILETPTSPFLLGHRFCTANSDGNRRDNAPNTAGEISPAGPNLGKISCMDQPLRIPGLRLPL